MSDILPGLRECGESRNEESWPPGELEHPEDSGNQEESENHKDSENLEESESMSGLLTGQEPKMPQG